MVEICAVLDVNGGADISSSPISEGKDFSGSASIDVTLSWMLSASIAVGFS